MYNEVKEKLEVRKSTVVWMRFANKKRVHKRAKAIHMANPNSYTLQDTFAEIFEAGVEAIEARRSQPA